MAGGGLEVYLHVGPPKTGSSSIQETLFQLRPVLLADGTFVPDQLNHSGLYSRFKKSYEASPSDKFESARLDWVLKNGHWDNRETKKIVISCEFFADYSEIEWADLAGYLRQFTDHLSIVLYARHPAEVYVSSTQELLKQKVCMKDASNRLHSHFPTLITALWSAFGRDAVDVRHYGLEGFDSVEDFFSVIATQIPIGYQNLRHNNALSLEGAVLLDALAHLNLTVEQWQGLVRYAQTIEGQAFLPDTQYFEKFQGQFDDQVLWCEQELGLALGQVDIRPCDWESSREAALRRPDVASAISRAMSQFIGRP